MSHDLRPPREAAIPESANHLAANPESANHKAARRQRDHAVSPSPHNEATGPARDRRQSHLLVRVLGAALALVALVSLYLQPPGPAAASHSPHLAAILISLLFAALVVALRAATVGGAISGALVCLLLIFWTAPSGNPAASLAPLHTALTPLILLFCCTFAATRAGRARKAVAGLAESHGGRNASQVLANLAAAALCAGACGLARTLGSASSEPHAAAIELAGQVLSLAALAEAAADTVSSEIGQAFGGQPRMLLSLARVPPGTDGAVSVLGTTAGILTALAIAIAGQSAMHLGPASTFAAAAGGTLGFFTDSLLGATVERRGWLGNDLVNFASTVAAALAAACILALTRL